MVALAVTGAAAFVATRPPASQFPDRAWGWPARGGGGAAVADAMPPCERGHRSDGTVDGPLCERSCG